MFSHGKKRKKKPAIFGCHRKAARKVGRQTKALAGRHGGKPDC